MGHTMEIKGKRLTHERPLICIPIVEKTEEAILHEMEELMKEPQDMIEWRIDFFEDCEDPEKVIFLLKRLQELSKDTILVATVRTKMQGGQFEGSNSLYEVLLMTIADSGAADLMDVEFFTVQNPSDLFQILKGFQTPIIASHHDFSETPELDVMRMLLKDMAGFSDVVKLAVMPKNVGDVLNLLKVTYDFNQAYPEVPIISMSMGKLGMVSRISGEVFGSCVTFGAAALASAPGQIERKELRSALDFMHEHYVD